MEFRSAASSGTLCGGEQKIRYRPSIMGAEVAAKGLCLASPHVSCVPGDRLRRQQARVQCFLPPTPGTDATCFIHAAI